MSLPCKRRRRIRSSWKREPEIIAGLLLLKTGIERNVSDEVQKHRYRCAWRINVSGRMLGRSEPSAWRFVRAPTCPLISLKCSHQKSQIRQLTRTSISSICATNFLSSKSEKKQIGYKRQQNNRQQTKQMWPCNVIKHGICYQNVCPSIRPSVCLSHSWTTTK